MNATVLPRGTMVERLNAIVEQVYKGNVEMLRAAVDECHRQRCHDLRIQRNAYFSTDTHQETTKERKKRLKKEKKEKKEQLVKEARENTMSPTVQEMSSRSVQEYLLPKCRELKIAGSSGHNRDNLAIRIKMELLRLRRQVHG
jgi:hypothetical protein